MSNWTNYCPAARATGLAVDGSGAILVTGHAGDYSGDPDYATIKNSGAGSPLWTNRYNGPADNSDFASAVAVDRGGDVSVTEYSSNGGSHDRMRTRQDWTAHKKVLINGFITVH